MMKRQFISGNVESTGAMLMSRVIIEAYIQMNMKVKRVKNMNTIDFKKVVIISNSVKI